MKIRADIHEINLLLKQLMLIKQGLNNCSDTISKLSSKLDWSGRQAESANEAVRRSLSKFNMSIALLQNIEGMVKKVVDKYNELQIVSTGDVKAIHGYSTLDDRGNKSYAEFMGRHFGLDLKATAFNKAVQGAALEIAAESKIISNKTAELGYDFVVDQDMVESLRNKPLSGVQRQSIPGTKAILIETLKNIMVYREEFKWLWYKEDWSNWEAAKAWSQAMGSVGLKTVTSLWGAAIAMEYAAARCLNLSQMAFLDGVMAASMDTVFNYFDYKFREAIGGVFDSMENMSQELKTNAIDILDNASDILKNAKEYTIAGANALKESGESIREYSQNKEREWENYTKEMASKVEDKMQEWTRLIF